VKARANIINLEHHDSKKRSTLMQHKTKSLVSLVFVALVLAACGQNKDIESPTSSLPDLSNPSDGRTLKAKNVNFLVNSLQDHEDKTPGDGLCKTKPMFGGKCTLRAAIEETNALAGADQITVPSGVYLLNKGRLEIKDDLVVMGSQEAQTIIDGQDQSTVVYVNDRIPGKSERMNVELHFLHLRNGNSTGGGGGILNVGAKVLVNRSNISNNTSFSAGGGIGNYEGGMLEVRYSIVSKNGDMVNSEPARGGGIVNGSDSYLLVFKSSVSENQANRFGGIANYAIMNVVNSTISTNLSRIDTGGIMNGGQATFKNATIAFNEGTVEYDGSGGTSAAGIHNLGAAAFSNTILANNVNHFSSAQDCLGDITSVGYNLLEDTSDCNVVGDLTGNVVGTDPKLFGLAYNGGPAPSHGFSMTSPVLNAGNPAVSNGVGGNCEATDQHNKTRGFGPAGRCDMGAFEDAGAPGGFGLK
jgi:CSLREA domain-containing protein